MSPILISSEVNKPKQQRYCYCDNLNEKPVFLKSWDIESRCCKQPRNNHECGEVLKSKINEHTHIECCLTIELKHHINSFWFLSVEHKP